MTNERFFRMLSIALLGAFALACVPDTQADSPYSTELVTVQIPASPVEIEVATLQEVEDINAGRFNPALAGQSLDQGFTGSGIQDYAVSSLGTVR